MSAFSGGMITMGLIIAGLFFLRFWRRTGDGLFVAFAFAFWLLGINQALISLHSGTPAHEGWAFFPRLAAFALLILAIFVKNFGRSRQRPRS